MVLVEKSYKYRKEGGRPVYVVQNTENGILGTDLFPADCDEDCLDERVDLQSGIFQPSNPTYVADGDFWEANPDGEYEP